MSDSTVSTSRRKASTQTAWNPPYTGFPLSFHPGSGRLYKKIRRKRIYFGYASDWQAAVDKYNRERDDLHAGRTPRPHVEGLTLRDLCNRYLTFKTDLVNSHELSPRTFRDCKDITDLLIADLGKDRLLSDLAADDFEGLRRKLSKTRGPVNLGNTIQRIRSVFKYAFDSGLIDKPIRFGPGFKRPSAKVLRQKRHENGKRMFSAEEIRAMLDAAGPQLKAMILLGINCGFGNADCGRLPMKSLDLDAGVVQFPRPKTAVPRRRFLWRETVEALRAVIANRPKPKDQADADAVFVTSRGNSWHKVVQDNPVAKETRKLLNELGITRKGTGFCALRQTFETVAGGARDQVAVNHVMGQADATMAGVYREEIDDDRLRAVVEHVHAWLFGQKGGEA